MAPHLTMIRMRIGIMLSLCDQVLQLGNPPESLCFYRNQNAEIRDHAERSKARLVPTTAATR